MKTSRGITFAQFEQMALAYPGVEARSSYGTPGLYVRKKFMARLRNDDLDSLVLKPVYDDEQRFLMGTQPDVFFLTPHYVGYPTILIRLSKVDRAQLAELLDHAWRRLATPKLLAERDGTPVPAPKKRARAR
jgi:hypothetical protein